MNQEKAFEHLRKFFECYDGLFPKDKAIFIEKYFNLPEKKSNFDSDLHWRAIEDIDMKITNFKLLLIGGKK